MINAQHASEMTASAEAERSKVINEMIKHAVKLASQNCLREGNIYSTPKVPAQSIVKEAAARGFKTRINRATGQRGTDSVTISWD